MTFIPDMFFMVVGIVIGWCFSADHSKEKIMLLEHWKRILEAQNNKLQERIEQLEICDECQHEQDEGVTCSRCGGRTRPVKDGEK